MRRADELNRFADLLADDVSVSAAAQAMGTTYQRARHMMRAIRRGLGSQAK